MGAWIETPYDLQEFGNLGGSHLVWVRGLKQPYDKAGGYGIQESHLVWVRGLKLIVRSGKCCSSVAPRVGAWIETPHVRV